MKKIVFNVYGPADVLELINVEKPTVSSNTLCIRVKAVSINPLHWKIREGQMKVMTGSKFPKGVGIDFSGIIEDIGDAVVQFKVGDAVFGALDAMKGGALSEYLLVSEKDVFLKPDNISFEEAAAIPIVGSAAMQIFDKLVTIKTGTEILINGATGGIGMFAVQMAKQKGAHVTAVVGTQGIPLVERWKADTIIDYSKTNILEGSQRFDVVIDLSGRLSFDKAKSIMKPRSVYVNTIPNPVQIITSFFYNIFSSQKNKTLFSKPTPAYLQSLVHFVSQGMEVVIGKRYNMSDFKTAYLEVPKGGIQGKAVFLIE